MSVGVVWCVWVGGTPNCFILGLQRNFPRIKLSLLWTLDLISLIFSLQLLFVFPLPFMGEEPFQEEFVCLSVRQFKPHTLQPSSFPLSLLHYLHCFLFLIICSFNWMDGEHIKVMPGSTPDTPTSSSIHLYNYPSHPEILYATAYHSECIPNSKLTQLSTHYWEEFIQPNKSNTSFLPPNPRMHPNYSPILQNSSQKMGSIGLCAFQKPSLPPFNEHFEGFRGFVWVWLPQWDSVSSSPFHSCQHSSMNSSHIASSPGWKECAWKTIPDANQCFCE